MKPLETITIIPSLPEKMEFLKTLANNLWWAWNHDAIDLFRRLDRDLWQETNQNPIKMLGQISQSRLETLAADEGYLAQLDRVKENLDSYLNEQTWYSKEFGISEQIQFAYFSAEFGLTECVPIYSGGLGLLAGDHFKSASDLGLPLVGVGLLYQQGYFHQYLNADGWQGENYPKNDFYNMPVKLQQDENNNPLLVEIDFPSRKLYAQIWKLKVGRIEMILLDTNIAKNNAEDRLITGELYGGDKETRIQQEIVLGIGGVRALQKLQITPNVYHMNEGHSAFLALERIRLAMEAHNLTFTQALELTRAGNVFTTHTPVPAGIDKFSKELIDKYFTNYLAKLGINKTEFYNLGGIDSKTAEDKFSMAVLAINFASHINGVSKLHGKVSSKMWEHLWPGIPVNENPIRSITNGVHLMSYISGELSGLFDRYVGPNWKKKPADLSIWKRIEKIPVEELWRTHERRRERLVAFARKRLKSQLKHRGALSSEIDHVDDILDPEALTICFARRFATYKRAALLFHDPDRLSKILTNKEFPVQIIYAGKAHPKDEPGKQLIKKIIHLSQNEELRQHIVFLENYDIEVARYLVQGSDVWLNTPRRPLEASGTSGMKAAMNGVINCSILDGWWDEAYNRNVGWAIGKGETYDDLEYQDKVESQALYNLLENEVVPLFYKQGKNNIPREWVEMMKNTMAEICPAFNTNRMIRNYTDWFYVPAFKNYEILFGENQTKAKELATWKDKLNNNWSKIKFRKVEHNDAKEYQVGNELNISAEVYLDGLSPNDVKVEIYHGFLDSENATIENGAAEKMDMVEEKGNNIYKFAGSLRCNLSGLYGYTVRVLPNNENLIHPHETGLILWANEK